MPVQLIITIDDNGQFGVSGPIDNKIQTYGMLEMAKDAVADYHKQKENRIQPATIVPPSFPGIKQ